MSSIEILRYVGLLMIVVTLILWIKPPPISVYLGKDAATNTVILATSLIIAEVCLLLSLVLPITKRKK